MHVNMNRLTIKNLIALCLFLGISISGFGQLTNADLPKSGLNVIWSDFAYCSLSADETPQKLWIISLQGSVILEKELDRFSNQQVNISSLEPGVYQVLVRTKGRTHKRKLVIKSH